MIYAINIINKKQIKDFLYVMFYTMYNINLIPKMGKWGTHLKFKLKLGKHITEYKL